MSYQESIPYISPIWPRYTDIVVEHGEGCYLYSEDGSRYLDFTCGIGVTNTGHCHPLVVEAIRKQAGLLLHGQVNIVLHKPLLELIGELRTIVPPSIDGFFFSNSGAEALEGAMKLARHATGRPNVIVFQGGFHGRTVGTMSLTTSKTVYRQGYQPLMAGVFVTPFPYAYRYGWDEEATSQWCLEELEYLLISQTAPQETAAIIIEGVLGEGGYVPPPASFMRGLRKLCDQHGILLIIDEVQSGFGRTGRWFAFEHYGIEPDIMTVAKGIASGMPLSGVFSRHGFDEEMGAGHTRRHVRRQCGGSGCCNRDGKSHEGRGYARQRPPAGCTIDDRTEEAAGGIPGDRGCARVGLDGCNRISHRTTQAG